jgi:hypothetical protein
MPEDPIKLFSSRADRYRQPDDGDSMRAALQETIEQIPPFGTANLHHVAVLAPKCNPSA